MNSTRLALISSSVTTAAWTAKAVAIGLAGGLGRSPLEAPLFLIGLVGAVVAAASTGVAIAGPGPVWRRGVGGLLGVVAMAVVGSVASSIVAAVEPRTPGWAWGEVNLWAIMLTLMMINLVLGRRRTGRTAAATGIAAPVDA